MRKTWVAVLTAVAMLAMGGYAFAGTATDNMAVSVTVVDGCSITAAALAFGNYGTNQGTNVDAAADLTVFCGNPVPYSVALDDGLYVSGGQKRMNDGGVNYVNYNLYEDAPRTVAWDGVTGNGTGANQTITVYGRIPSSQASPAGSYTDTVVATITW